MLHFLLAFFLTTSVKSSVQKHLGDLPLQNPDLFEGDILGVESIQDRNTLDDERLRWPDATIYYVIDPSLRVYSLRIEAMMKNYEKNTCLKFVKRTTERDYVKLFQGVGCYSHVGKTGGEQPLSLGEGCTWNGIMAHELGHAIGFLHEQNRSDRDNYISIYWENIKQGMEDQFTKWPADQNVLYNEFEYESIMLYGERAFSKNNRDRSIITMAAKKDGVRLREVYEKYGPTESDYYRVRVMYKCE